MMPGELTMAGSMSLPRRNGKVRPGDLPPDRHDVLIAARLTNTEFYLIARVGTEDELQKLFHQCHPKAEHRAINGLAGESDKQLACSEQNVP
jgi:hypothetical protein